MPWVTRQIPKCSRCGHEWLPESPTPKRCAKCKDPNWDKPRTLGKRKQKRELTVERTSE